jgi:hypothetical protein
MRRKIDEKQSFFVEFFQQNWFLMQFDYWRSLITGAV